MLVLVIGDSHGNIANIKHVMGFGKKIVVEAVIHTGDWNTIQSVEEVLEYKIPLYTVLGNADIDPKVGQMLKLKCQNYNSEVLMFKIGRQKFGVVHKLSTIHNPLFTDCEAVFTGHYHSQKEYEVNGVRIIRPGALENSINFVVYNTKTNSIEFVNHKF